MMFEEELIINSEQHKWKHKMFGVFVCTGMAHLVLTTFEVPDVSYIRIFLVGAFYIYLAIAIRIGQESPVFVAAGVATFSMFSSLAEYLVLGGHFSASMLVMFDGITIFLILNYIRMRDDPLPDGVHKDDLGLKHFTRQAEKAQKTSRSNAPA